MGGSWACKEAQNKTIKKKGKRGIIGGERPVRSRSSTGGKEWGRIKGNRPGVGEMQKEYPPTKPPTRIKEPRIKEREGKHGRECMVGNSAS